MAFKSQVTPLTAQDATETVKTLTGTIQVPLNVKAIIGVASQVASAGLTTLEDLTHIIELESDDGNIQGTQQFLGFGCNTLVTSGVAALNPYVYPTNIPVQSGAHIKFSISFNKALTVNPSCRGMLQFE